MIIMSLLCSLLVSAQSFQPSFRLSPFHISYRQPEEPCRRSILSGFACAVWRVACSLYVYVRCACAARTRMHVVACCSVLLLWALGGAGALDLGAKVYRVGLATSAIASSAKI
jgi:hypothetical protein